MKCNLVIIGLWLAIAPHFNNAEWCVRETTISTRVTRALTRTVTYRKWFLGRRKTKTVSYTVTELIPRIIQHRVCCEGYTLDRINRICEPNCAKGFQRNGDSCEPICDQCPVNAFCSEPSVCECESGFKYNYSTRLCDLIESSTASTTVSTTSAPTSTETARTSSIESTTASTTTSDPTSTSLTSSIESSTAPTTTATARISSIEWSTDTESTNEWSTASTTTSYPTSTETERTSSIEWSTESTTVSDIQPKESAWTSTNEWSTASTSSTSDPTSTETAGTSSIEWSTESTTVSDIQPKESAWTSTNEWSTASTSSTPDPTSTETAATSSIESSTGSTTTSDPTSTETARTSSIESSAESTTVSDRPPTETAWTNSNEFSTTSTTTTVTSDYHGRNAHCSYSSNCISGGHCVPELDCRCNEGFVKADSSCQLNFEKSGFKPGECIEESICKELTTGEYSTEPILSSETPKTSTFTSTDDATSNCEFECLKGMCINGVCQCPKGSVLSQDSNDCVVNNSSCDNKCQNGICQENGVCECLQGFVYEHHDKGCVPYCGQKCINGICLAPGKCKCLEGFKHSTENFHECLLEGKSSEKLRKSNDFTWMWVILPISIVVIFGLFLIKKQRNHVYNVETIEKGCSIRQSDREDL